jgi:hypothetical protein
VIWACHVKVTRFFETSGVTYPATQRHIPENTSPDYTAVKKTQNSQIKLSRDRHSHESLLSIRLENRIKECDVNTENVKGWSLCTIMSH